MSSKISLTIRSDVSQTQLNQQVLTEASRKYEQVQKLKNFLSGLEGGAGKAVLDFQLQDSATGTLTVAASGASALQIGSKALVGGTDYVTANLTAAQIAANVAAAINASSDAQIKMVVAEASAAVVTVTSLAPGVIGNLISLSGSGQISAGASTLAGGSTGELRIVNWNLVL